MIRFNSPAWDAYPTHAHTCWWQQRCRACGEQGLLVTIASLDAKREQRRMNDLSPGHAYKALVAPFLVRYDNSFQSADLWFRDEQVALEAASALAASYPGDRNAGWPKYTVSHWTTERFIYDAPVIAPFVAEEPAHA